MIRAGQHDEWITIISPTVVIDDQGAERETWATVIEMWSDWQELGSTEAVRNPLIVGELNAIVTIRHPGVALNSTMRIRRNGGNREYEIRGINQLPKRGAGYEIQVRGLDKTMATVA